MEGQDHRSSHFEKGPFVSGATRIRLAHSVVVRDFVTETVLLDVNTGRYHKLDSHGAVIAKALIKHGSVHAAADALASHGVGNPAVLTEELVTLSMQLLRLNLIRPVNRVEL